MSELVSAATVRRTTAGEADAVEIDGGTIVAVGMAEELRRPGLVEHHYPGGVILPGLVDNHLHPAGYAVTLYGLVLKTAADLADLADRLRRYAATLPPSAPVVGNRLDDDGLAEGRLPTREDLDAVLPDRPVILHRYCGHVAVVNTAALEAAGVGPSTPDPPGGSLDRDDSGRPTGVLRETAVNLVSGPLAGSVPAPPPERLAEGLSGLAGLGITRIGAMVSAGAPLWCGSGNELDDLLAVAPDLPLAVEVFVMADSPSALEAAAGRIAGTPGRVRFAGWKEFADGSLGGHTAALEEPYADQPDTTGTDRLDPVRHRAMAETALGLGGSVAIHAIGDRANSSVLDLFEVLLDRGVDPGRLRVEHASVLSESLIERFARLGVTASVQPSFLTSEAGWVPRRVGPVRLRWTYPFRSLDRAGVRLLAGSDSPVEAPDPWPALAAARSHPLTPDESLPGERALAAFTSRTIEQGAPADLVVVDRDPIGADPSEVRATGVLAVWSGGMPVTARPLPWPG